MSCRRRDPKVLGSRLGFSRPFGQTRLGSALLCPTNPRRGPRTTRLSRDSRSFLEAKGGMTGGLHLLAD